MRSPIAQDYLTERYDHFRVLNVGDDPSVELGGLADGVRYAAAVRAANLAGEESNVSAVFFTADSSPPGRVDALLAASTSRSGA